MFSPGASQEADGWGTVHASRMRQMSQSARKSARRARRQILLLLPLIVAVILAFTYRRQLFGLDVEVRIGAVIALVCWAGPSPATSGAP